MLTRYPLIPLTMACLSTGLLIACAEKAVINGLGCDNIAVLLPEAGTSARWEAADRPLLVEGFKSALPDATVTYANANGSAETQTQLAERALANGACILIVAPVDSTDSTLVELAAEQQVPVIAYDRLIQSDQVTAYVSFDNTLVGELQGQYLVETLNQGDRVVLIHGSEDDNNALLFRQGVMDPLQPWIDQGQITIVYDEFTPGWSNDRAQAIMEDLLEQEEGNIQIAYVANDGMASGVISALRRAGLNGQVVVTGQDATVVGIRNIVLGDQGMTVYKPIPQAAEAAVQITKALVEGDPLSQITTDTIAVSTGGTVPFVRLTPIAVTQANIAETVIQDGFVSREEVCEGLPAGTGGVCN